MIIAVNTRLLKPQRLEGIGVFTLQIFQRLVEKHPEHQFHFIYDHTDFSLMGDHSNVFHHRLFPPARRPWLFDWWLDFSIPRLLKKIKADIFISPDGHGSLRCTCPSLTVIHDLNFLHFPHLLPKMYAKYWNRHTPQVVIKSTRIATVSDFSKQDIINSYGIPSDKIDVLNNGYTSDWAPISDETRKIAQTRFSGGSPYFIYVGSIHPRKNVQNIIAGFDLFKDQHKTNFDLVIVGTPMWEKQATDWMKNTRHAEHIHWAGRLEGKDLHHAIAGANALLLLSIYEGFGIPMVEAFACGTPVLAAHNSALIEVGGDAVLFAAAEDVSDIASKLHQLSVDTSLCDALKQKGLERKSRYTWERAADSMWNSIQKTIQDAQGKMES